MSRVDWRQGLRQPIGLTAVLGAGFYAFVAWDQSYFWRLREDYRFGWLVPALAGYVLYERWPRLVAAVAAGGAVGAPQVRGVREWLLRGVAGIALLGGGGGFLLGCLHRATVGPSQPGTLIITLGAVAIVSALVLLTAPESAQPRAAGWREDGRVRLLGALGFPLAVWLISAPLVSVIERPLNLFLLRQVMTGVAAVFDLLGLPIEQQGNVLVLPLGRVGVQDACSGIRSLTGSLLAGSFLAAVTLERGWAKGGLVAAALALALAVNFVRATLLTLWAYRYGPETIEGLVHDLVGYAELGATVGGLYVLLVWARQLRRVWPYPA